MNPRGARGGPSLTKLRVGGLLRSGSEEPASDPPRLLERGRCSGNRGEAVVEALMRIGPVRCVLHAGLVSFGWSSCFHLVGANQHPLGRASANLGKRCCRAPASVIASGLRLTPGVSWDLMPRDASRRWTGAVLRGARLRRPLGCQQLRSVGQVDPAPGVAVASIAATSG